MKAIDLQLMCSTKMNPILADPQMVAQLATYFKSGELRVKTDEEMIQDFRDADVQVVILDPGAAVRGESPDWGKIREVHDYLGHLKKTYPDVVLGAWIGLTPEMGIWKALSELERCIKDLGTFGVFVTGLAGTPATDKLWFPFYDLCSEAKVPIKISVGSTGGGAGQPGGGGIRLWSENPIPHVDDVAAQFPELTIICHHYPWPFEEEMIAVMIHKGNVYNEVHGWRPKYFTESFRRAINTRVQDKVMFGSDYPMFSYQRLFPDWESGDFRPEVLEKVYYKNAQRVLGLQ